MPMFQHIQKLFSSAASAPAGLQQKDRKEAPASPNFLTDPFRIQKLLTALVDQPQRCTVTFSDNGQEFSTSILEIQPKAQTIIVDAFHPDAGNELFKQRKRGKLSTYHNGIHLAFVLENPAPHIHQKENAFKLKYPDRIYYPQRRHSPRVQLQGQHIPFAGLCQKNQASAGGLVYDLSRTGLGLTLSDNHARIQRGDILKHCHIVIDNHRLKFDLNIRFVKKDRTGNINIGGFFENISSRDQHKLSAFVAQLERKHIRNAREFL